MLRCIFILLLFLPLRVFAQGSFTVMGSPYTQDFNSLPNTPDGSTAAWTNNTTLAGWYIDEGIGGTCGGTACDDAPTVEATYTSANNGGNSYIVASGSDRSLGSRAAGSTGTVHIGLRIVNSTGLPITSVYVDYYGEQWSIAENQSNVNSLLFAYQTGVTVTSLTAGTWTNVTALNFTQIYTSAQSAGMGGSACSGSSAQCLALDGNQTANRVHIQGCVTVTIPAGEEIMLRWTDVNDAANDHHLQIDDVSVYPYDVNCATVLPVEWLSFTAEQHNNEVLLEWETASETNNDYFVIERAGENGSFLPIGNVDGSGNTTQISHYRFTDTNPLQGINYYRIQQVDFDGDADYSSIQSIVFENEMLFTAEVWFDGALHFRQSGQTGYSQISVISPDGRIVSALISDQGEGVIAAELVSGIYLVEFINGGQRKTIRIFIPIQD